MAERGDHLGGYGNIVEDNRFRVVSYAKRGRVAHVTLNRPSVLNALNLRMHDELKLVWDDFERDDEIWVAVLTGAGDQAFSVGQDLKELAVEREKGRAPSSFGSEGQPGWPRLTERFQMKKPLIARVNGYALGGGLELALACDVIVAADYARFGLPEAKVGLIPGAGGLFRLVEQIPSRVAMGYLMTGRQFSANRAYEIGLINDVAPAARLDSCVDSWVEDILRAAPLSVRAIKQVGSIASHLSVESAFRISHDAEVQRRFSHDSREGVQAFLEKRVPKWEAR
jgi:crotonobetainyl-CoA hydratase/dehydration protein DpgD